MKTVWKYEIPVKDAEVLIRMPAAAKILHVGNPLNEIEIVTMWVEVHPDWPKESRAFQVFGTDWSSHRS